MVSASVLDIVKANPALFSAVSLSQTFTFIQLAAKLQNNIILVQSKEISDNNAPKHLPPTITAFLWKATNVPLDLIPNLWTALKDIVWLEKCTAVTDEEPFEQYWYMMGIGG